MRDFKLSEEYLETYKNKEVDWGPLGEVTYLRTYSRKIPYIKYDEEGKAKHLERNENWWETVKRVVEGCYNVQKKHCETLRLPWKNDKAQKSAQIMYDKIFNFKFLPPGRGLWAMGTSFIDEKGSAALNNCGMISTQDIDVRGSFAFTWTMDALMLGVGVGFDTKGGGKITIKQPKKIFEKERLAFIAGVSESDESKFAIPDSREGWVESLKLVLDAFFYGKNLPEMDYSLIRPYGEPIKGFGGVASGPEPLKQLHIGVTELLSKKIGEKLTSVDIVDIMNMIGVCVVAGNVRRSAEIALGDWNDEEYLTMKNPTLHQVELNSHRWACLTGETIVDTENGSFSIESLVGKENFNIILDSKKYNVNGVKYTGDKEVFLIETISGQSIKASNNHQFMTTNGWKRVDELSTEDFLKISDNKELHFDFDENEFNKGYLIGHLIGDGTFVTTNTTKLPIARLQVYEGDDGRETMSSFIESIFPIEGRKDFTGRFKEVKQESGNWWYLQSKTFTDMCYEYGITKGSKKLNEIIENQSLSFISGIVSSLFDTDGWFIKERNSYAIEQIEKENIYILQRLLLRLGVKSNINFIPKRSHKINNREVNRKDLYRLILCGTNETKRFIEITRLKHSSKINLFEEIESKPKLNNCYKIKSITPVGIEPVFDMNVEEVHAFSANGFFVHNSNNSVFAEVGKTNYKKIAKSINDNGEPGFVWLENVKKFSRTVDAPDWKDKEAVGVNPSLRAGTKVITTDGIFPIEKLEGKEFKVKNLNGKISSARCFLSGKNKKLYKLTLKGNHEYYCTPEHKWPIRQEDGTVKKTLTTDIKIGDYLPIIKENKLFDSTDGSYNEGFLFGYNLGDGWITTRGDNGKKQIGFILNNEDYNSSIKEIIEEQISIFGSKSKFKKHHEEVAEDYEINTQNDALVNEFEKRGFLGKSFGLPNYVFEKASEDFRKGLIDGLFSSDGYVSRDDYTIGFSSSQEKLAKDVSELLGFYGIKTQISKEIKKEIKFPNGKIYDREYISYQVRIRDFSSKEHFKNIFHFSNERKQSVLNDIPTVEKKWINDFIRIENIELTNIEEDVWDINVMDTTHCFQLAHCITGNCGEQTLENAELCCLVETFPSRHETYEEFRTTLKFAYLYAKTVTLIPTHWPETNAILMKNRRIGLSQTGIIDAFVKHGRRAMLRWSDEGYKYIQQLDELYSNWLCIPRSKKTTTVKPSGTVSLLPGVNPGIHYPHSEYYIRRIRIADNSSLAPILAGAGYQWEYSAYGMTEDEKKKTLVFSFPVHEKFFIKKKSDVSIWEQVKNAVDYQRFWSDNNVSITVNFKKEEEQDIPLVLEAYEDSLKSISFLPYRNDYMQAPYEEISKEQYEAMASLLTKPDFSTMVSETEAEKFCSNDSCSVL